MASKRKKVGLGVGIPICLGILALVCDFVFGWPNIRYYFKAPGPVYGVLSNQALKYVLKNSNITEKLEDYKFYVLKPALMSPITKGDYEGDENYKWCVNEMYISLLENILSRNELFEYHIDKDKKKVTAFHSKLCAAIFNGEMKDRFVPEISLNNYSESGQFKNAVYLSSELPKKECKKIVARQGRLATGKAVITTGGNLRRSATEQTMRPVREPAGSTAPAHRFCQFAATALWIRKRSATRRGV